MRPLSRTCRAGGPIARRTALLIVLPLLVGACATSGGRVGSTVPAGEARYLLPPAEGWPGRVPPARAGELSELHRRLLERDDRIGVLNEALAMSSADPGFDPATVLEAQVRYLADRYELVLARLEEVRQRVPGYVALEVLFGRAAERLERPVEAYEAYWSVRESSGLAAERVEALRDPVIDALSERLRTELGAGEREKAIETLARLETYAPTDPRTLVAAELFAEATDDPLARLMMLRRLTADPGADEELLRRRAELELTVGDAAAAVRLAEGLVAARPADPGLGELLQRAQFQWRLNVLPEEVGRVARQTRLSRSDFALLLYWLFPEVRYGRPTEARIATDIIDHPHREPIVRVINLGLMRVDPTVHRFAPDEPVGWSSVLGALLEILAGADGEAACRSDAAGLCAAAEACGLMLASECGAGGEVSGSAGLEMIRRTLARTDAGPAATR